MVRRGSLQIKGLKTGLLVATGVPEVRRRSTYREDDHNGLRNNSGRRKNSQFASTSPRTTSAAPKQPKRKSEAVGKGHNDPHCREEVWRLIKSGKRKKGDGETSGMWKG